MRPRQIARSIVAIICVLTSSAARAQVGLSPVVSGLSSPVFVGHAGDNTSRLFIVEQPGRIKVLQPGSSTPTVFLDISTKVLAADERGLVGLAFHPMYSSNRRFFVFYTRQPDGALVIAEYLASATNQNVADTSERVFLTIPHSDNAYHNGGMLAFGQDGNLYIGVGDGGGDYDPAKNAQNTEVLLGKILRIDVDHPASGGTPPYTSPAGNPFVADPPDSLRRDEIFALGMRNPWRFSFDRITGQQWVADVGQDQWEEIDTAIEAGGNYGWRVYEGLVCTNQDPLLCGQGGYLPPVFVYGHTGARCSITGGYVYRGSANVVPSGTYVFGDFCSGEIFTWNGSAQSVLFDTTLNISSFGEDQQGELFVVGLGGTISRLCTYSIPTGATVGSAGGSGTVAVTAPAGCNWTADTSDSWLKVSRGAGGTGNGTVSYTVQKLSGKTTIRSGSIVIAGQTFTITQTK